MASGQFSFLPAILPKRCKQEVFSNSKSEASKSRDFRSIVSRSILLISINRNLHFFSASSKSFFEAFICVLSFLHCGNCKDFGFDALWEIGRVCRCDVRGSRFLNATGCEDRHPKEKQQ